jgi:hypothetical protein
MVQKPSTGKPPGRPRTRPYVANETPVLPPGEDGIDTEADAIARIRGAFNESGEATSWKVSVYQVIAVPGRASREAWIDDYEIDQLDNLRKRLAEEYGAGRYRCRAMRDGRPFRQYDVEIATSPRRSIVPQQPLAAAPRDEVSPTLLAILERQDATLRLIAERMTAPAPVAGQSVKDMVEMMVAVQKLVPPPAPPNIGIEMFNKGIELAQKLGNNGGETNLLDVVREAFNSPVIQGLVARAAAPAPIAHNTGTDLPEPSPAPLALQRATPAKAPARAAAPPAAAAPGAIAPEWIEVKNYLIGEAAKGTDPQIVADWTLENLPPGLFELLEQSDDPVGSLQVAFPEIAQHRAWFEKMLSYCYEPDAGGQAEQPANDAQPGRAN